MTKAQSLTDSKDEEKYGVGLSAIETLQGGDSQACSNDQLHRRLGSRHVQLIAIGAAVGTATFITIGSALARAGPGSLLIAVIIYSGVLSLVNNCIAEMTLFMPISTPFVRMAGHWVDPALGFMAGWNFWIYEAVNIPFEISAVSLVLSYWSDEIPVAAVVVGCMVLYLAINIIAVRWYGEAEFWLSSGKVILTMIVYMFTLVTMCGGNPKGDAYGFRYWNNPGAFAQHLSTGSLGRFEGFLAALWNCAFFMVGPEYVSMVAGETKAPRRILRTAFKTTYVRFFLFFVLAALCVGIVIPYNDPTLVGIVTGTTAGAGTGAASPYVIAMGNLGVTVLPHITSAFIITSIFSAGNAYVFCGSRTLYGMALEGQAPKFLLKVTKSGVPIYCLAATLSFGLLAFLNVSSSSAEVLSWLVNILTASAVITFIVISLTFIFFYRACKAQGFDRHTLPYYGRFQPYCGWIALIFETTVVFVYGYSVFTPGNWDIKTFFTYYTMVLVDPVFYIGWKIYHRTKIVKPEEADLVWEKPAIDAYEDAFAEDAPGFWVEMSQLVGLRKAHKY